MTEVPLNHPGDETLRALSLDQLTEAELVHVSAHLAECPECCLRIDQLDTDDPLLVRVQQGDACRKEALVTPDERRSAVRALRQAHEARPATPKPDPETVSVILPAPKQVGDYDILAEVGRGGMGVVPASCTSPRGISARARSSLPPPSSCAADSSAPETHSP